MATIRFQSKIDAVLANVTSVVLCDPTGLFGIQRTSTGATLVAANTVVPNVSAGTYEYVFTEPANAEYIVWIKWVYAGETHYRQIIYTATSEAAAPAPSVVLTQFDNLLIADAALQLAEWGESLTVHPAVGLDRTVTGIVLRPPPVLDEKPRVATTPLRVQLLNNAVTGISTAEWTNRFQITVAPDRGGAVKRLRVIRPVYQDAGLVTWEVG